MDMDINVKLGKRLKMIRIAAGIKQKDLSNELNVPAPLLSMYENGIREPSLNFLEKYSEYFRLPISQIFILMEEDKPNKNEDRTTFILKGMKNHILCLEKELLKNQF